MRHPIQQQVHEFKASGLLQMNFIDTSVPSITFTALSHEEQRERKAAQGLLRLKRYREKKKEEELNVELIFPSSLQYNDRGTSR